MVENDEQIVNFSVKLPNDDLTLIEENKSLFEVCRKNNIGKHYCQKFYQIEDIGIPKKFDLKSGLFGGAVGAILVGIGCITLHIYKKSKRENEQLNKESLSIDMNKLDNCVCEINNNSDKFISLKELTEFLCIFEKYSELNNRKNLIELSDEAYKSLIDAYNSIVKEIKELDFKIINYEELSTCEEKNEYLVNIATTLKKFMISKGNLERIYLNSDSDSNNIE